jgi:hypothetical protein
MRRSPTKTDQKIERRRRLPMATLTLIFPGDIDVEGANELYVSAWLARMIVAMLKEAQNTGDVVARHNPLPWIETPKNEAGIPNPLLNQEAGDEPMKNN